MEAKSLSIAKPKEIETSKEVVTAFTELGDLLLAFKYDLKGCSTILMNEKLAKVHTNWSHQVKSTLQHLGLDMITVPSILNIIIKLIIKGRL